MDAPTSTPIVMNRRRATGKVLMDAPISTPIVVGRRKATGNVLQDTPEVQLNAHLSSIVSVRSAVEAACRDGGTAFKGMGDFGYNSFFAPLMGITEQMKALMWAIDRWAFRAKYMRHINSEIAHIYKDQTITDECRCAEITPRLQQCCPYDWSYRRVFACVIEDLEVLDKAARALVKFLSLICAEGNVILCDGPAYLRASDEKTTCNDETAPVFSTSSVDKDLPWSPNDASSLVNLIDPTLSPYEASPTWKLKLAHKYPIEQLYVGATELQVFAQTLGYARLARKEVVDTTRLIKKVAALADDMQEVFDMWSERCKGSETKEMGEAECVILEELIFRKAGWAR